MVEKNIGDKRMKLLIGDITDLEVEAFVYDITDDVQLGFGYGSAITSRGGKVIQDELNAIGSCPTGEAIVTSAGKMKAKYIVHVNGPKFFEQDEEAKLRRAVKAALQRAEEKKIHQLAFPPIGTGLYQVDRDLCARVMINEVTEHLKKDTSIKEVLFVALDNREFKPLQAKIQEGA